jgi:hypothetical protein
MRTCTVCVSPEREQIDKALIDNAPFRVIARQFGISKDAVRRHKETHLPRALVQSKEIREVAHADDLVQQMADLTASALRILKNAEKEKDNRTALAAIREVRGTLQLNAKLIGELNKQKPPSQHLHLNFPCNVGAARLKRLAEE